LKKNSFILFILFTLIAIGFNSYSQTCQGDYAAYTYNSNGRLKVLKTLINKDKEIYAAGSFNDKSVWIAKLSQRGTVIWSKAYEITGCNITGLVDFEWTADGGFIASANGYLQTHQNSFN
jgi:hypothetical protein